MPLRRWIILVISVVSAIIVLTVECCPLFGYIGNGSYTLTVHIDSQDKPPTAICCIASWRRGEIFDISPLSIKNEQNDGSLVSNPYGGQPLEILVEFGSETSRSGRMVTWTQQRFLIVIAVWSDGRKTSREVEIPTKQISSEVRVSLP
jgi:hypothetical protein